ncbi:MAG: glycosyltransferase family 39 protein [Acidobacteriia bacterium]|nr:glycosyltransferase family 39 protein [Terriglobia bacterium]
MATAPASRLRTDWLLLAGFCGFLFFFGLSSFGLVGADEPRYAQVAREMLARHDWITPTLGGKPWLEKPPLYYWQAMLSYSIFGVSDWASRLPSAVDAALMVLAVYFFLRRFRPGSHLDGALMTASAAGVIGFARAASTDMPLAATFTIALLAWYAWYESQAKLWLAIAYVFLGLGTLAKGPVAPFLAAMIVVIFATAKGEYRLLWRSLWIPGILLACVIVAPWFVAVQLRNPEFFHTFILQHNVERFSTNLYHHRQPFWFYIPVALLGLVPWTLFAGAAVVEAVRTWWGDRREMFRSENALGAFLTVWFIVPILFFSLSQSKLPGYILPALPAGTLLLAEYVRRHTTDHDPPGATLAILHALVAAVPVVPALMIQYIVLQHRLPWGKAAAISCVFGAVLAIGIAVTLRMQPGLGILRFVTLVPVVLAVAAVLRLGAPALDSTLSTRPLAEDIARLDTRRLPIAVFRVRRETEFGLAFYRNQAIERYERDPAPAGEHLVVAAGGSQTELAKLVVGRRVSYLGSFAPQGLDYYWVAAPGMSHEH